MTIEIPAASSPVKRPPAAAEEPGPRTATPCAPAPEVRAAPHDFTAAPMNPGNNVQELHWLLDVLHSANVGIVVLDRELRVEVFNLFMQVHSGLRAEQALGETMLTLFPEVPAPWFQRRIRSVFELGIPVFTSWEERPYLLHFPLQLPIHHDREFMYQNVTFMPLRDANQHIERVGIIIYDVTDAVVTRRALEAVQVKLLRLSRTDRLTGLWSRGYWEERLQQEWQRMQRSSGPASLVMFDIDHFKRINDSYGHPVGDQAIRLVAQTLRDSSRNIDIGGRYGGEEFAVILPDTPLEGGYIFCERLRCRIERQMLRPAGQEVRFTISLGVAEFNENIGSPEEWLERADRALYLAKHGGRNQTQKFST